MAKINNYLTSFGMHSHHFFQEKPDAYGHKKVTVLVDEHGLATNVRYDAANPAHQGRRTKTISDQLWRRMIPSLPVLLDAKGQKTIILYNPKDPTHQGRPHLLISVNEYQDQIRRFNLSQEFSRTEQKTTPRKPVIPSPSRPAKRKLAEVVLTENLPEKKAKSAGYVTQTCLFSRAPAAVAMEACTVAIADTHPEEQKRLPTISSQKVVTPVEKDTVIPSVTREPAKNNKTHQYDFSKIRIKRTPRKSSTAPEPQLPLSREKRRKQKELLNQKTREERRKYLEALIPECSRRNPREAWRKFYQSMQNVTPTTQSTAQVEPPFNENEYNFDLFKFMETDGLNDETIASSADPSTSLSANEDATLDLLNFLDPDENVYNPPEPEEGTHIASP